MTSVVFAVVSNTPTTTTTTTQVESALKKSTLAQITHHFTINQPKKTQTTNGGGGGISQHNPDHYLDMNPLVFKSSASPSASPSGASKDSIGSLDSLDADANAGMCIWIKQMDIILRRQLVATHKQNWISMACSCAAASMATLIFVFVGALRAQIQLLIKARSQNSITIVHSFKTFVPS
jgi:hypothetical protein